MPDRRTKSRKIPTRKRYACVIQPPTQAALLGRHHGHRGTYNLQQQGHHTKGTKGTEGAWRASVGGPLQCSLRSPCCSDSDSERARGARLEPRPASCRGGPPPRAAMAGSDGAALVSALVCALHNGCILCPGKAPPFPCAVPDGSAALCLPALCCSSPVPPPHQHSTTVPHTTAPRAHVHASVCRALALAREHAHTCAPPRGPPFTPADDVSTVGHPQHRVPHYATPRRVLHGPAPQA